MLDIPLRCDTVVVMSKQDAFDLAAANVRLAIIKKGRRSHGYPHDTVSSVEAEISKIRARAEAVRQ